jgi:hypothetical protein
VVSGTSRGGLTESPLEVHLAQIDAGDHWLVILKKCTHCGQAVEEALTWSVWAWMKADHKRVAYKHKLCLVCLGTTLVPLYTASQEPSMTCPSCGIDTSEDMDPCYCTFIPKGLGKLQADMATCPACAVTVRLWVQDGGELLEDRDQEVGGQAPGRPPNSADYWASIGLTVAGSEAAALP